MPLDRVCLAQTEAASRSFGVGDDEVHVVFLAQVLEVLGAGNAGFPDNLADKKHIHSLKVRLFNGEGKALHFEP